MEINLNASSDLIISLLNTTVNSCLSSCLILPNNKNSIKGECIVCGMCEWCGTDGCPNDPQ